MSDHRPGRHRQQRLDSVTEARLANGHVDLFHESGEQAVQMMMQDSADDVPNIDDLLDTAGPDLGDWASTGKQSI